MAVQKVKRLIGQFNLKVLVVDDCLVNCEVANGILELMGCNVEIASCGSMAIDMARQNHYDLILMDLQMPEMDGYEATEQIRQNEAGAGKVSRIVALSANICSGDIIKRCLNHGMNDCIAKPLRQQALEARLEKWGFEKRFHQRPLT